MKRTQLNNLILEAYAEVISELNETPSGVHYIKVESTELMEALGILEKAFADTTQIKFELNDPDTIYVHNADNADMHDAVEELQQNGIIIDETSIDSELEGLSEMDQSEVEDGTYAGRLVKIHMHGEVTEWYVEFANGKKVPYADTIANIKHPSKPKYLSESLLDEVEEEDPTPEEDPDPKAGPETVLEDATDTILAKFPSLRQAIIKLQTEDFKEFIDTIDWISPRPTSFRVNLKNGQDYILKWTGKTFEAQIMGKRYLLSNIAEYQQALDKLAILYRESPMKGAGEEGGEFDADTGGGGGGGDFPGGEEGGGDVEDELGAELGGGEGGEEGGEDLTDEPIDFESGEEG